MLRYRYFISCLSTIIIYCTGIYFLFFHDHTTVIGKQKVQEKTLHMNLSVFVPQEVVPVEEVEEEAPEEDEEVPKEPIVEEKPKPQEVKPPEPIVKKEPITPLPQVETKKPAPVVTKQPKKVVKKSVKKKHKKAKKRKKKRQARKASVKSHASQADKNAFLAMVRSRINRHRHYPTIAKRRRMQGSVKVSFTILPSGNVSHIVLSGPKIFQSSARQAVEQAFPINVKGAPVSLPKKVNILLRYQIR